jgi:hypothetical protein
MLLRAIERHGGWSLWLRLQSVGVGLVSLRGLLPRAKGYGRTFQLPGYATAFLKQGRTIWSDRPDGDPVTVFQADAGHRHSLRRQSCLFAPDGLLRRNDYVADVLGPFARSAGPSCWRRRSIGYAYSWPSRARHPGAAP